MRRRAFAPWLALGALLTLAGSAASLQFSPTKPVPPSLKPGFDSITKPLASELLHVLAGEDFAGRGTGQLGYQRAAEWVASKYKEYGLKPIGDGGSYFQYVPFERVTAVPSESYIATSSGVRIASGADFAFSRVSADFTGSAGAVLIDAHGQEAAIPEGTNLEGKVVFVRTNDTARQFQWRLRGARAAAVINIVEGPITTESNLRRAGGQQRRGAGSPAASITEGAAKRLLASAGIDLAKSANGDSGGSTVDIIEGKGTIDIAVKAKIEKVNVPNVVGYLPGSDPTLAHEYIGLGAHLDHLGVVDGVTYYGADDDGSGTTAMLMIAQAFHKNQQKPKRGMLFMAFCGEEMGLIGSGYYADNPILPLKDMVCLLQMDMVGRNEESANESAADNVDTIHLVGSQRLSMDLHNITLQANEHIGFKFEYDEEDVYTRSDHAMFAAKGVPITFVFSGFHPDYHQPTDTVEKINFEKIVKTAQLNYLVANMVANRPQRLVMNPQK